MPNLPVCISESNLSLAWGKALQRILEPGQCPLMVVSLEGFPSDMPEEDSEIREDLDALLKKTGCSQIDATAMTIFPYKMWLNRKPMASREFSKLCTNRLFPRLKAIDVKNRRGTYFQRMMAYQAVRDGTPCVVDQVSEVVERLTRGKQSGRRFRVSGLQISCFDADADHSPQTRLGFPCLQQVGVAYEGTDGIAITGFYPSQYIFDRAYGNYLGLAHLGRYICDQTKLRLRRITCVTASPKLGNVNKGDLRPLARRIPKTLG